ncbi:MAG: triphosphoribosyl-dephospho-CoA synthase [Chloroflexi bacterium]|nr:MAG: triphosphoribosyl-dephospho-CoA synthase [Chloroflexota bacterium]
MRPLDAETIAWAAQMACLLEVSAEKPGNVTRSKDFWDTHLVDFLTSAVAIGPALQNAPHLSVGETVLRAVQDTRRMVRTNTNLGMILLLAPLVKAAGMGDPRGLRASVRDVLAALSVNDAQAAFEAIRLAAPGGLGDAERYDVRAADAAVKVDITLRQAMELARERDAVAREYVTDFAVTFEVGYTALHRFLAQGHRFADAIVQTALTILAQVPDTLIARKEGREVAEEVSRRAGRVLEVGGAFSGPGRTALTEFDHAIRDERHRLNPGTTADLTAAAIFVYLVAGGGIKTLPDLLDRW